METFVLDTGIRSASANMELDAALLEDMSHVDVPILHFYDWEASSLTYGHFIDPEEFLDLEVLKKHQFQLAKRPTGGGIVFHHCDLAFSLLLPRSHPLYSKDSLKNYHLINEKVLKAILSIHSLSIQLLPHEPIDSSSNRFFCMAKPTKYDLMIGGKKVGGAAQRNTCDGLLHQASIALILPEKEFLLSVLKDASIVEAMFHTTYPLLNNRAKDSDLVHLKHDLKKALQKEFLIL